MIDFHTPVVWFKTLSKGVKTHLSKSKTRKKIRGGGASPPCTNPPPPPQPGGASPLQDVLLGSVKKNDFLERGGGMIENRNIYPCQRF